MPALIQVSNLVKHFNLLAAVDDVSFEIPRGICFGLLGPNGAGKTTTIEMMEGIKTPDSGQILYKGEPLGRRFRNEAGIMFQNTALQEFITVAEMLKLFSRLYPQNISIDKLVEQFSLQEFLARDTSKLSGGQRQRLLLALALLNKPDMLFLDEPTTGLDPQARRNMWTRMQEVKAQGGTILLTTHYMDEAYELCDEIAIMDRGKIISQGSPDELLAKHFNDVVVQLPEADLKLNGLSDELEIDYRGDYGHIVSSDVNHTIEKLLTAGVTLTGLRIRARNLEDLFLELTGKELRS